jgi:hypothetical protein
MFLRFSILHGYDVTGRFRVKRIMPESDEPFC